MTRPRPGTPTATSAPRLDPLVLGELESGDQTDLRRAADLESVHYRDVALERLDLSGARVQSVRFDGLSAADADLSGAFLREVELERVDLPVVRAARSRWGEITLTGRLGAVEAYDTQWRSVHFVGCKLSFLSLRAAELTDVAFTDCIVEELDLLDATVHRLSLSGTRVGQLTLRHSTLVDVDLRGADLQAVDGLEHLGGSTISTAQLALLAPLLAESLGIRVED